MAAAASGADNHLLAGHIPPYSHTQLASAVSAKMAASAATMAQISNTQAAPSVQIRIRINPVRAIRSGSGDDHAFMGVSPGKEIRFSPSHLPAAQRAGVHTIGLAGEVPCLCRYWIGRKRRSTPSSRRPKDL